MITRRSSYLTQSLSLHSSTGTQRSFFSKFLRLSSGLLSVRCLAIHSSFISHLCLHRRFHAVGLQLKGGLPALVRCGLAAMLQLRCPRLASIRESGIKMRRPTIATTATMEGPPSCSCSCCYIGDFFRGTLLP